MQGAFTFAAGATTAILAAVGSFKPQLGIIVILVALTVVGAIWYGRSHPPVVVEKPRTLTIVPVAAEPAKIAPPPAEIPVVVAEATPVAVAPAPDPEPTEIQRRVAQDRKLTLRVYGKLLDELALNPDQREKLIKLLIDSREASADYAGATAALGTDASGDQKAFAVSVREVRQQINAQIHDLLGDDGYAQFQAGDLAARQTSVIDRAQKELKVSGDSLSPAQATQLQALLSELGANHVDDAVIDRASQFLNPTQLGALQRQQAHRNAGANKERVQDAIQKNLH